MDQMSAGPRRVSAVVLLCVSVAAVSAAALQRGSPPDPLVKANATEKVSEHVYVIPDFSVGGVPNVGIIVGNQATLVVDTGMGVPNGQTIVAEMSKVSTNQAVYVVSTHFHPEHALGEPAFPATTKIVRAQAQQQDMDEFGLTMARQFASQSPLRAELLKDARFRKADILFDKEYMLELGGVRAVLRWLGPTHTRGDTIVWIETDRILFAGDVVMNRRFVSFTSPYSSVAAWLGAFEQLEPLHPVRVVPSHGPMGDASLIAEERAVMKAIQARAVDLKRQGKSADEVAQAVQSEMQAQYSDWTGAGQAATAARVAFKEAQ